MARIEVQKVASVQPKPKTDNEKLKDIVSSFCYYFPQYSFEEALELSIKTVRRLLKAARREQAMNYIELLQIHRAATADKPKAYNNLIKKYEKDIRNG